MQKVDVLGPLPASISPGVGWLDLQRIARVEVTSEAPEYGIDSALRSGGLGWRAGSGGTQIVRLLFLQPQRVTRIWLRFVDYDGDRTQQTTVSWLADGGRSFQEIVRQQWNFSPRSSTSETEDYRVVLNDVNMLQLLINPDISGGQAIASLSEMRLA